MQRKIHMTLNIFINVKPVDSVNMLIDNPEL